MTARDYEAAPVSEQLGLGGVIAGLVADLESLRAGQITVSDAVARSMLAKQIFNGVRLYLNSTKMLSDMATPAHLKDGTSDANDKGPGRSNPNV